MKKWLVVLMGTLLLTMGLAVLRRAPSSGDSDPSPQRARAAAEFTPVEVLAPGAGGLALTGQVLDPMGAPVVNAEVSLASSLQAHLHGINCSECGERLAACRARESALSLQEFLDQGVGALAPAAVAHTDPRGHFRFEHLSGVSFTVWARAPGWGEAGRERAAPGDPVTLVLPPLRSIAGQLVNERGQPISGGTLYAVSHRLPIPRKAVTDERGLFELGGLGEGPFWLLATARGHQPTLERSVEAGPKTLRMTLLESRRLVVTVERDGRPVEATVEVTADHVARKAATRGGQAMFTRLFPDRVVVRASSGNLGSIPLTVTLEQPVTHLRLALEVGAMVRVTVVDEGGLPVPDPAVALLRHDGEVVERRVAPTGELVGFGPLAVGNYRLRGTAKGYVQQELPVAVRLPESSVELVMPKATVISGRVLDEYGRPAPGVSILVSPIGDSGLADAEGRFTLPVPTPGLYQLHAHHSDWGGGLLKVAAPAEGVELLLEPRAGAEVTVSAQGRRVEGANVVMYVERQGSFRSDRPSGSDGRVLMRGMPAGSYWLVAMHPEYLPSEKQRVELVDGELARLSAELKVGAHIAGEVVDSQGVPISGVAISVVPRGAEPTTSNGAGHFELGPVRPQGLYRLEARHPSYELTQGVEAKGGEDSVRIILRRKERFTGRVRAEDGAPLKRFRIDEHQVDSSDGRFEVPLAVVDERVIFAVEAPGFEPLMVDRPATPDLGDLVLRPAPVFTGLVQYAEGEPVPEAVVSCDVCSESVLTSADGRFQLTSPPFAAQFAVSARKGRLSAVRQVTAGANLQVALTLQAATRLYGTAYLSDGRPAPGAELQGISLERTEPVSIVTGPDGKFSMELPPGLYRFNHQPLVEGMGARPSAHPVALTVEVHGADMQLDFGPAPGTASLTARVRPQRGHALWLVRGPLAAVGNPPVELMRSRYAILVYQPHQEEVTLTGIVPGIYTLVWGSFHGQTAGGPRVVPVSVPSSGMVELGPADRLVAP